MKKELFPALRKNLVSNIDRWFDELWNDEWDIRMPSVERNPKIDMKETEKEIIIEADIPGVDKKDISLDLNDNVLTISYEKKQESDEKNKSGWRIIERSYGKFSRSISLPQPVKQDSAKAEYKDGVLKIKIEKEKTSKSKQITIE